jgi:hypothetical protein
MEGGCCWGYGRRSAASKVRPAREGCQQLAENGHQHGLPAFADYAAVIHYGRYSSRKQQQGASEERQIDRVDEWAARAGVAFTDRLIDQGKSGFHGKHRKAGDFGTLLNQAQEGAIPTPALVVLAEGDRAGREDVDVQLESLVLGLLRSDVHLYVVEAGLHLNLEKWRADLGAQIQLQAILHGANQYSRRLSARMKDAHQRGRARVKAGEVARPGWAPSWIDLDSKTQQWSLNSYADTVRRLLELLHHQGYNATARQLNDEGHRPPRGKAWTQGSVCNIVHSEAIAGGRITLRRDPSSVVWGYYPPLMERVEWQALLARIAARDGSSAHAGNQQNVTFIGQGLTVCHHCGRPVGARVASYKDRKTGERHQRRYVRCRGRSDGSCDAPALPLPATQAHLLTRLSLSSLSQLSPQRPESELSSLQSEVVATQQQIEQQQAIASNGQQQISLLLASAPDAVPVVAQAVTAAKQQVEALEQQLHQTRQRIKALESDAARQLGEKVVADASALLQLFSREEDTPEVRRELNHLLRELDLRVTVDAHQERIGLAVGDSPIDWQPLAIVARRIALEWGVVDPASAWDQPGIGAAVITRDGELLVDPLPGEPPADPDAAGYEQGLEDARRLLGR